MLRASLLACESPGYRHDEKSLLTYRQPPRCQRHYRVADFQRHRQRHRTHLGLLLAEDPRGPLRGGYGHVRAF